MGEKSLVNKSSSMSYAQKTFARKNRQETSRVHFTLNSKEVTAILICDSIILQRKLPCSSDGYFIYEINKMTNILKHSKAIELE